MPTFTTKTRTEGPIVEGTIDAETREAAVHQLVESVPDDGSAIDILEVIEVVAPVGGPTGATGGNGNGGSGASGASGPTGLGY